MPETSRDIEAAFRLSAIVESSDDAIVSKDLNGTVMSWNRAAERMFGYTAQEMVGKPITTIIPAERLGEEDHVLDCVRRGIGVDHYETERRHKDGHIVDVSLTVSPIRNSDGTIVGASKIARDIGERKRLTRRARARKPREGRVPRHAVARARTPLNAILGYARLLRDGWSTMRAARGRIETIERNATALAQLVVGRARRVAHHLRQDAVRRAAVRSRRRSSTGAVESIVPAVEPRASSCRSRSSRRAAWWRATPDRLQQVFWNLLSNAVKFTPAGGRIRRAIDARDGLRPASTVQDSGRGIRREVLPHIFERFHQGDSSTTREVGGLGLGLALVRHYRRDARRSCLGAERRPGKGRNLHD